VRDIVIGFAICGSFCTFETALKAMRELAADGAAILPVMSYNAAGTDTRFGTAESFKKRIEDIAGRGIIETIEGAEPIGPNRMCDVMVVAPCTGNTLAKLAGGITDTPVTMAVKSHLRNGRPVVIALSTNDALAASAKNLGELLNRRNYYFVPMSQDAPQKKPASVMADFGLLAKATEMALAGVQMQPVIR
jgi:dipicolinate synthase subunit B